MGGTRVVDRLGVWAEFVGDLKIGGELSLPLFDGATFCSFGPFLPFLVNFDDFLGRIFPFFAFFGVRETVYSQTNVDPV
jgi:hypothetical protein